MTARLIERNQLKLKRNQTKIMVESRVPNQRQPRPLANCEVKNLLEMHLSSRAQTTNPSDNALGQESGNELRQ